MVLGLALVGVAFVILGIWLVRQTRHDLQALAPLERMGDRDWTRHDPSTQRRMLDEVRPEGAEPLRTERMPPTLDHDFEQSAPNVSSLSDLGPGIASEGRDPTPAGASMFETDLGIDGADHADDQDDASEAIGADEPDEDDDADENDEADEDDEADEVVESSDTDAADEAVDESEVVATSQDVTEPATESERATESEIQTEPEADASLEDGILTLPIDLRPPEQR